MPRPRRAIPYEQFKVSLPAELAGELRLRCFSPLHVYGAPKGAISTLFEVALRDYFARNPLRGRGDETQPHDEKSDGGETAAQNPPGGE